MPRRVFRVKKKNSEFVVVNIHGCVSGSGLASYGAGSESVSRNMVVLRMTRFLRSPYSRERLKKKRFRGRGLRPIPIGRKKKSLINNFAGPCDNRSPTWSEQRIWCR